MKKFVLWVMAAALFMAVILSFNIGRYPVPPDELMRIVAQRLFNIQKTWSEKSELVVFSIRLPRILLACMVGGCLAVAGASYQGIFRNPMASPDVLGASNGAAFGAALAILYGASKSGIAFMAFASSIVCVTLVVLCSKRAKGNRVLGLVLAGIMIGSLFQACTSWIKLVADPNDKLPAITYWMMGSLAGVSQADVNFALWPMLIGCVPLFALRWQINLLTMSEDEARTMGINTGLLRFVVILCATLITAACVSVSGMIGWVGLVVPHMARRLVGNDYRKLLPASLLLGATFLLIVDDVSRSLYTAEIPIGILTAFIGAPFFIFLLSGRGGRTE